MTNPTPRKPLLYAVMLASALVLAACGDSGDNASPADTTTTSSPARRTSTSSPDNAATTASATSTPADITLAITVKGKTVTPAPHTVNLGVGKTLALTVTADHADELHAHGFEVEVELAANTPKTILLTGRTPDVYEVETHHPELRLLMVAVR